MKVFFYFLLCVIFVLVTFFGLGPVIFADGTWSERIITFIAVLIIYLAWAVLFISLRKKSKKNKQ